MNIFILDLDPEKNAQYHVDKHVVKMITEHNQLLCTAHHVAGSKYTPPYKKTHANHPCAIWVRESLTNYIWLTELNWWLCKEYTYRYGKNHKGEEVNKWCIDHHPNVTDIGQTMFKQAMPNECKRPGTVEAYRAYYNSHKRNLFAWKKREVPVWIKEI